MRSNSSSAAGANSFAGCLLRFGDRLDQRVAVEGINLVEDHDGHHQPVAHRRRSDGALHADDARPGPGAGRGTQRLHQQAEVRRIARNQDVGFQPLDGHDPAELAYQVTVLRPATARLCSACRSVRPLVSARPVAWANSFSTETLREARLNSADGVDLAGSGGCALPPLAAGAVPQVAQACGEMVWAAGSDRGGTVCGSLIPNCGCGCGLLLNFVLRLFHLASP